MSDGTARQGNRWVLVVGAGVAVFAFTRVRASVPSYVSLHGWLAEIGVPAGIRNLDGSMLLVLIAWLGAMLAGGGIAALGLRTSPLRGAVFGCVAGLPMLLQAALAADSLRFDGTVARGVLLAPFVEETFFRGLLVAVPVGFCGAPFWPIAIVSSLLFGAAHVPWTSAADWSHAPTFAVTAAGGLWYAWIARSFGWNLWTTITLHAVMNGAWLVFAVAGGAVGGFWPNVGRGLTIALGTAMTLRRVRAHRGPTPNPAERPLGDATA